MTFLIFFSDFSCQHCTIDAKHGCWVAVRTHNGDKSEFAKGVFPSVDIDFPAKTPNGATVKKRYQLEQFC